MSRNVIRLLGAWLCLGLFVPAAAACINDRESDNAEKEFKSRYIDQQTPKGSAPASPTTPENRVLTVSATAVGAVLLIGAVTVTVLPRRRRE